MNKILLTLKNKEIRQMNPSEKLKEIRTKEKLNQAEFAQKYGLKENAIAFIERGKQSIPDDLALLLEKEYKIPFKWWKTGEGGMSFLEQSSEDTVKIPIDYDNSGSCGAGYFIDDNKEPKYIHLGRLWLKKVLGASLANLAIVFAKGDSMEPTIRDGDMLLVDKTQINPDLGVFLLRFDGQLLVKRIVIMPEGINLVSDNKKYDFIPVTKDAMNMVNIIGKVIWNGSRKDV